MDASAGEKPIDTCKRESCGDCEIRPQLHCRFNAGRLALFYLIVLPSFIIGWMVVIGRSPAAVWTWLAMIVVFFGIVETRILCSHCPHYAASVGIIRCHANFLLPKLWKYRSGPMNGIEKTLLITGFTAIWGYPAGIILLGRNWFLLAAYLLSVAFFFVMLRLGFCRRCVLFSCPLNRVDSRLKNEFLKPQP